MSNAGCAFGRRACHGVSDVARLDVAEDRVRHAGSAPVQRRQRHVTARETRSASFAGRVGGGVLRGPLRVGCGSRRVGDVHGVSIFPAARCCAVPVKGKSVVLEKLEPKRKTT